MLFSEIGSLTCVVLFVVLMFVVVVSFVTFISISSLAKLSAQPEKSSTKLTNIVYFNVLLIYTLSISLGFIP
ncbi:hypothetical protein SDC9_199398 [bioreactor metagenome]|uniref:Uncharacterized protein n=1 Tax=bioreactor metagenome TaxID=1076179 RepID=A0A645IMP4_9ZZZZ